MRYCRCCAAHAVRCKLTCSPGFSPSFSIGSALPAAGGKTASLKALGLAALMPKAGLFIPVTYHQSHPTLASESLGTVQQPSSGTSTASGDAQHSPPSDLPVSESLASSHPSAPRLLFFDRVLADVGDSQSLEQNLSTFSGHVRRMGRILKALTPSSLVLLDEVGCCLGAVLMAGVPRTGPGLRLPSVWCMCAVWAAAPTPCSSVF